MSLMLSKPIDKYFIMIYVIYETKTNFNYANYVPTMDRKRYCLREYRYLISCLVTLWNVKVKMYFKVNLKNRIKSKFIYF